MAVFNLIPSGQPAVAISGIVFEEIIRGNDQPQRSSRKSAQAGIEISGIIFDAIIRGDDQPEKVGRKLVSSTSVAAIFGGEFGGGGGGSAPVTVPSTGQVWPISGI